MKDNFSDASAQYALCRPGYPEALFTYLKTLCAGTENAWDCATGNGQAAQKLAAIFRHVYATDISQEQVSNAIALPNISYAVQPAEKTSFPDHFFDLVMVAQAVHWFNFEQFYAEVQRVAKKSALLAITGYGRVNISPAVNAVIDKLYYTIVGPYWDSERRYIDEHYKTIPFPFEEVQAPPFGITYEWTLAHLTGYLDTWSAVKHYRKQTGRDPLALVEKELAAAWAPAERRTVQFPLLLRIGKVTGE